MDVERSSDSDASSLLQWTAAQTSWPSLATHVSEQPVDWRPESEGVSVKGAPILVGIDGTHASIAAMRWAALLASVTERNLVLGHAWQRGEPIHADVLLSDGADAESIESAVSLRLDALAREILGSGHSVVECRALRGEAVTALSNEATRTGASLIVVGAHGDIGPLNRLRGSVSQSIVTTPTHTTAVVPDTEADVWSSSRSVVVGVDGSDESSRASGGPLEWHSPVSYTFSRCMHFSQTFPISRSRS